MKSLATLHPPVGIDRRKCGRRLLDGDPPGKHERRKGLESRQPEVLELDMSPSEWIALSDLPMAPHGAQP